MPTSTIHVGVVKKNAFKLILFHAHFSFSHNLFHCSVKYIVTLMKAFSQNLWIRSFTVSHFVIDILDLSKLPTDSVPVITPPSSDVLNLTN